MESVIVKRKCEYHGEVSIYHTLLKKELLVSNITS